MGNLKISKDSVEVVNLDFATGTILNKLEDITDVAILASNVQCAINNCYNCNEVKCSQVKCSQIQCTQVHCNNIQCSDCTTIQCSGSSYDANCNCDCSSDCKD